MELRETAGISVCVGGDTKWFDDRLGQCLMSTVWPVFT